MTYRFEGIDDLLRQDLADDGAEARGGWRVAERPAVGGRARPWEHTRYKARTSRHFLALAPTSMKVGSLMTDLEKGRAR